MEKIEILACKGALKKMALDGYVSICVIDAILKVTGGVPKGKDYNTLKLLHCMQYKDMDRELLAEVPNMVKRVVEAPQFDLVIDAADFSKSFKLIS